MLTHQAVTDLAHAATPSSSNFSAQARRIAAHTVPVDPVGCRTLPAWSMKKQIQVYKEYTDMQTGRRGQNFEQFHCHEADHEHGPKYVVITPLDTRCTHIQMRWRAHFMGDSDIFDSSRLVGSSQIRHCFHHRTPVDRHTYKYTQIDIYRHVRLGGWTRWLHIVIPDAAIFRMVYGSQKRELVIFIALHAQWIDPVGRCR